MSMFSDLIDFGMIESDFTEKLKEVRENVARTKKKLSDREYILSKAFLRGMKHFHIPLDRWSDHWEFYDFIYNKKLREKLEKQQEELDNIETAISLLKTDKNLILDIQIAREYPIENLIGEYKLRGNKKWLHCPFHEESTPSFMVDSNNRCHCFSCGFHGDSISVVQKLFDIPFRDAVRKLQ